MCKAAVSQRMSLKYFLIVFLIVSIRLTAQDTLRYNFISGRNLTIKGRSSVVDPELYNRLPNDKLSLLPEAVQLLSRNSAGIQILFQTNAQTIRVQWLIQEYKPWWNMTPVAACGLDLYGWSNEWQFIASAKPVSEENDYIIVRNLDGKMRHYMIYLPLYSEIKDIKIGVDDKAIIMPANNEYLPSKKVVIYGSSITQGASASRPGMTYSSIMGRCLNIETFNLGFSGSGKMEIEMAAVIAEMPADLFILDCVPNTSPEEIKQRTIPFVRLLRETNPDVPILMVESIIREVGYWDAEIGNRVKEQNREFKEAYEALKNSDMKLLFYLDRKSVV